MRVYKERLKINCIICGKERKVSPSDLPQRKCCSKKCATEYAKINPLIKSSTKDITRNNKIKIKRAAWYKSLTDVEKEIWKDNIALGNKQWYIDNPEKLKNKNEKNSETMSLKISSGQFNPYSNHKHGTYISAVTNNTESYHSIFELAYMIWLDEQRVSWTKNHSIRIPYILLDGSNHKYVPDFLVGIDIIEIKPSVLITYQNNPIKFKAAKKYCKLNGYSFKIVTEKELGDYIIKAQLLHGNKK